MQAYLPGCLYILRSIVHNDYSLRHRLAHDTSLYLTLIRGGQFYCIHYNGYSLRHRLAHDTSLYLTLVQVTLLFSNDGRTCYEVTQIRCRLMNKLDSTWEPEAIERWDAVTQGLAVLMQQYRSMAVLLMMSECCRSCQICHLHCR
ncbi:uncharacterized protein LOC128242181 [Mya arenaria]|uniref:uncharacterized protein LOC128242181 n=1 Tax=Mya arenaria TaxID=6604 RepID=UPI0022E8E738|nr:uncharacterized protein LOC128242181 [Mya arenaria]